LFELAQVAGAGAAAFGKDQQRGAPFTDDLGSKGQRLDSRTGVFARHRNVTGSCEVLSEKWNLEKATLGEEAKLDRDVRQRHRRIHVAGMIRYEHIAAVLIDLLETFYLDSDRTDAQQRLPPS